ncbi:MAG: serine hydrolase [Saprospiraceae bacterium]
MKHSLIFGAMILLGVACQKADIPSSSTCTLVSDPAWAQHPRAETYQTIIDQYVALGLPGISLYIQDEDGEWAGSGGMADIEAGIAFQPCTVSKVASITKMFVGTLAMLLAEDGVLDLDAPVDPWLPSRVLDKVANVRGATLRQLLGHTTGIYDIITDNGFYLAVLNDPDKHWEAIDLIEFAYGKNALFPLGTSCRYSNTNTLLVSMVIDKVTGRPLHQLLRERILEPLAWRIPITILMTCCHRLPPRDTSTCTIMAPSPMSPTSIPAVETGMGACSPPYLISRHLSAPWWSTDHSPTGQPGSDDAVPTTYRAG